MSLYNTNFLHYHIKLFNRTLYVNQILWQQSNSIQLTDDWNFDHVIMWQIKNVTVQFPQRLQSINVVRIHIRMKHYYYHISHDKITRSRDIQKNFGGIFKKATIIKIGKSAYQNERVPYAMWPNHAKVIKATAPKLALMKDKPYP